MTISRRSETNWAFRTGQDTFSWVDIEQKSFFWIEISIEILDELLIIQDHGELRVVCFFHQEICTKVTDRHVLPVLLILGWIMDKNKVDKL